MTLRHRLPLPALSDAASLAETQPVVARKDGKHLAGSAPRPQLLDLFNGDLRHAVASAHVAVTGVVRGRAQVQMVGSHARRVIAAVADEHAARYRAVRALPRDAM